MLSEATSIASLTKDFFQFLNFIKGVAGTDVISSYHRFDGNRVDGSSKIDVEMIKTENDEAFYLTVKPLKDYIFVRFPLNSSGCEEEIATLNGETYPDPNVWRWMQSARSGTIVGGQYTPPNAKVDFVVVGYKPKALTNYLSKK